MKTAVVVAVAYRWQKGVGGLCILLGSEHIKRKQRAGLPVRRPARTQYRQLIIIIIIIAQGHIKDGESEQKRERERYKTALCSAIIIITPTCLSPTGSPVGAYYSDLLFFFYFLIRYCHTVFRDPFPQRHPIPETTKKL